MHLLSMELFGQSLIVKDFPTLRAIRGIGMSDKECYPEILAEKFDYANTYYDREPRLDFMEVHPQLHGQYDFILCADVLEHIASPVQRAVEEACRLLKPTGFLGVTVYCNPGDQLHEHFPELHDYRIVHLGETSVLVNRRSDGSMEIREDLIFHGDLAGATLEMREFGVTALKSMLLAAGFREVNFLRADLPEIGILFDHDVSQPLIARKDRFAIDTAVWTQMVEQWRAAQNQARKESARGNLVSEQMRLASGSRWLRLGRVLGVGPRFS